MVIGRVGTRQSEAVSVHVLQVTPYFPPTWAYGGIPRIVDGLSRALKTRGVAVTVLTTDAFDHERRAGTPPDRDHGGVRVLTVRNASNSLAWRHQLFLPAGAARALDLLEQGPPVDVVHLHGHRHLLNNAALRWARPRGLPYVMTANGTLTRHERKIAVKYIWDLMFSGPVPLGAARCVAVSAADVAQHARAGVAPERIVRIPNGLDLGEFEALPPRGALRARLGLGEAPLVVYLGQISPRKGVEHLIAAFAGGALGDAALVIGGASRDGALPQAGPNVHFTGTLAGRERLELLSDADVLVYPSADEIFGLVPFEGLLCGAPVVVADDCGCGELIAQAGAGLLVRHADVEGLRARVRTLLRDREAADAMVERGRRFIHERLSFARVAERHEALYHEVIGEARR